MIFVSICTEEDDKGLTVNHVRGKGSVFHEGYNFKMPLSEGVYFSYAI